MSKLRSLQPFGVYVHWPYCRRICPYCDFNVYKHRPIAPEHWRAAFTNDLHYWANRGLQGPLTSIYFGGGTPSLMPPSLVSDVIETANRLWGVGPDTEISMEANPTDAESALFATFAAHGVNRISLGIQSFDHKDLSFLGRNNTAKEAYTALTLAQQHFNRVSLDFIYGLPHHTQRDMDRQIAASLSAGVDHLSWYQLTVEPGTAFAHQVARGAWQPLNTDQEADHYAHIQQACATAGLPAYEISNHAKPGQESRHNLLYWQYHDYIGIGPGAHGRVQHRNQKWASTSIRTPAAYLAHTPQQRYQLTPLTREEQAVEFLVMGLRLVKGIHLSQYQAVAGKPLPENTITRLVQGKLAAISGDQFWLTPKGRPLLNSVLQELLKA